MSIIQQKAIGYWDFRSGSIDDLKGSNDGIFSGTPPFNREGLHFDGTDYITVADNASLDVTGAMTVSAWVKVTSIAGATVIVGRPGATSYKWILYRYSGTSDLFFYVRTATGISNSGAITLPLDKWVLVTGVYDRTLGSNRVRIYLNEGTTTNAGNGYDEDINSQSGDSLDIARYTANFVGDIGATALFDSALTQSEVSQLMAEMKDTVFPTKPSSKSINKQKADINESGLVGAWDMKPVNGKIQDLSSNNNTGTINGKPNSINSSLGYALKLNGVDADVEASDASLNFQGKKSLTLSAWVMTNVTTGTHNVLVNGLNQYAYTLSIAVNGRARIVIDGDFSGDKDLYGTSLTLRDKQWHHLAATLGTDGTTSTLCLYVDGVLENSSTFSDYTMTTSNNGLFIGRAQATYANSTIANTEIYDEAKSAAWVTERYRCGASTVNYKTDWGIKVSSVNTSVGELDSTGWIVDSGTWQIKTDTIDGVKVKCLACTTDDGFIYRPTDTMGMNIIDSAYGTWEFYWKQYDANNFITIRISDVPNGTSPTGYIFHYGENEEFRLRKETAGSISSFMVTANSYFTTGQWYKIKITRGVGGVWTAYCNNELIDLTGGSGTNPSVENTFTTAKYLSIQARATDLVAFADIKGDHSFTKKLGIN
jgi:hypothetical protein